MQNKRSKQLFLLKDFMEIKKYYHIDNAESYEQDGQVIASNTDIIR